MVQHLTTSATASRIMFSVITARPFALLTHAVIAQLLINRLGVWWSRARALPTEIRARCPEPFIGWWCV
jgi:hypothetical protein